MRQFIGDMDAFSVRKNYFVSLYVSVLSFRISRQTKELGFFNWKAYGEDVKLYRMVHVVANFRKNTTIYGISHHSMEDTSITYNHFDTSAWYYQLGQEEHRPNCTKLKIFDDPRVLLELHFENGAINAVA